VDKLSADELLVNNNFYSFIVTFIVLGKLLADELSADELSADEFPADKLSADELSVGELPLYHI
jgi:hypothetical protein